MNIIIKSICTSIFSVSLISCSSTKDILIDDINKSTVTTSSSSNSKIKDLSNIQSTYIELEFDGKYVTSIQEESIIFFKKLNPDLVNNISDWSINEIEGNNNATSKRKYRFTLYGKDVKKLYNIASLYRAYIRVEEKKILENNN